MRALVTFFDDIKLVPTGRRMIYPTLFFSFKIRSSSCYKIIVQHIMLIFEKLVVSEY